jgi:hypothetical protein
MEGEQSDREIGYTVQEAMALIEVRALLRDRGIEVDSMTDEEVVGFVNRTIRWLADIVETHEPIFSLLIRMAHQKRNDILRPPGDSLEPPEPR